MAKKTASPHESSSKGNQIAITVTEKGPYLVTGNPPLAMQFIIVLRTEKIETIYGKSHVCQSKYKMR